MSSQFSKGELWSVRSVAQYNTNNSWLYNGNNGTLNNNNKYNDNSARAVDYDIQTYADDEKFIEFMYEMYEAYEICKKNKRGTTAQLEFEFNFSVEFLNLCISVYEKEYIPQAAICFMLETPRLREVIAAMFRDRVVQTYYVIKVEPVLEQEWFVENSFSCRKGKGGLAAVLRLKEYIREITNNYIYDAVIIKRDFRACFMSIDSELLEKEMREFIMQNFGMDPWLRENLIWLTRILYRSLPQKGCIIKTHKLAWLDYDPKRSMLDKLSGLAIGNRPSQMGVNFLTTFLLVAMINRGYYPIHYTDDTTIVTRDYRQWQIDEKYFDRLVADDLYMEWHKHKKYVQPVSHGVEFLGYKIRFDRLLPSDRIAHMFLWKTKCAARKSDASAIWMHRNKESFQQTFNSYCGWLKWCNSNRLKNEAFKILQESRLSKVYDFHGNVKITLKKNRTLVAYYIYKNKQRKIEEKHYRIQYEKNHRLCA